IFTAMDGVGAKYEEIDNLLNNIKDHSKWEVEEAYFQKFIVDLEESKKHEEKFDEIKNRFGKISELSEIELEYFKYWLEKHCDNISGYPSVNEIKKSIDSVIITIIDAIDDLAEYECNKNNKNYKENTYSKIDDLLRKINDHDKWEIDKGYFYLKEETKLKLAKYDWLLSYYQLNAIILLDIVEDVIMDAKTLFEKDKSN
ncbi:MAG: hypothetical protein FWH41_01105, partial [Treponema sp.]|nr:hypothetical protein [Treponema sp.]